MIDPRTAALRLAAVKAVKDVVAEAEAQAKAEAMACFDPGDRKNAVLPTGESLATITRTVDTEELRVVSDHAFLKWVKANRPDAIVQTVRESDRKQILMQAKSTGELPDGVELVTRSGFLQVRQSPEQKANLQQADWGYIFSVATSSNQELEGS